MLISVKRRKMCLFVLNCVCIITTSNLLISCDNSLPTNYDAEQKVDLMTNNDPSNPSDAKEQAIENNLAESNSIDNSKSINNQTKTLSAISGCITTNQLCVANITGGSDPDNILTNVGFNNTSIIRLEVLNQSSTKINNLGIDTQFPNSDFSIDKLSSSCINPNKVITLNSNEKCTISIRYKPTSAASDIFNFRISGTSVDNDSSVNSQLINLAYSTN